MYEFMWVLLGFGIAMIVCGVSDLKNRHFSGDVKLNGYQPKKRQTKWDGVLASSKVSPPPKKD